MNYELMYAWPFMSETTGFWVIGKVCNIDDIRHALNLYADYFKKIV